MSKKFERLFFALWPDQLVRDQLSEVFKGVPELAGQGRQMVSSNLHITLHFLGNIPLSKVGCFIDQANKTQCPSFELKIDRLGYFKKPKISWLGPVKIPPALLKLQFTLGENINHCGFQPELRRFQPHVSMARKINKAVITDQIMPVHWEVERFALVKSISLETSVKYEPKMFFPLR